MAMIMMMGTFCGLACKRIDGTLPQREHARQEKQKGARADVTSHISTTLWSVPWANRPLVHHQSSHPEHHVVGPHPRSRSVNLQQPAAARRATLASPSPSSSSSSSALRRGIIAPTAPPSASVDSPLRAHLARQNAAKANLARHFNGPFPIRNLSSSRHRGLRSLALNSVPHVPDSPFLSRLWAVVEIRFL